MDAGVRVVRGPDWTWDDQDGGEGNVGTLVKPDYAGKRSIVIDGTVFVRWDSGKFANYRVADGHDLRILSSATFGVRHPGVGCDICGLDSFLGTRWKCSVCDNYDLCDECYHGDLHDLSHPFFRIDNSSSERTSWVLVPARSESEKIEAKGVYPGATVVRSVHDWLIGEHDGGSEASVGSVLANYDGDADDDSDSDGEKAPEGHSKPMRRQHSQKSFGCVRVMWDTGDIVEHRRGYEGKVDVWCLDVSSGGHYYRDHLAVLDAKVLSSCSAFDDSDVEGTDVDLPHVEITRRFVQPRGEVLERMERFRQMRGLFSERTKRTHFLLPGNSNFQKGDRVQVSVDLEALQAKQDEEHGGWVEDMALCVGMSGIVAGVLPNDNVVVRFHALEKKFILNPEVLTKRKFCFGDSVQILADEEKVRSLQKGHGGWVCRMKDMLGRVGTVIQADNDDILKVKLDKWEWILNAACCKLVSSSKAVEKNKQGSDSDSSEENTGEDILSHLFARIAGRSRPTDDDDDDDGVAVIVEYAAQNNLSHVQAIVAEHPDKIDIKNAGKTALHLATARGHVNIVKFLLEKGASVTLEDLNGNTSIHHAAYKNRGEILELLLAKGDNASVVNYKLRSALHVAVYEHAEQAVQVLLRHSANINAQDQDGNTPLHTAVTVCFHGAIDMLLDQPNLDFGIVNHKGLTILHLASMRGDIFAVEKILLNAPQNIIDVQEPQGHTALHIASLSGYINIIEMLVTKGKANMELVNSCGHSPLLCGLSKAHASVVEMLVLNGANANAVSADGTNCLHWIMQLLAGDDAQDVTPDDLFDAIETTLIYSELPSDVPYGPWVALACFLVRHGANLFQPNHQGVTPISLAVNDSVRTVLQSFRKED